MRASPAALLLVGVLALAACSSFQGARLYERGTRTLDAGDPERAVSDLERASELVPHASEIQNHLGLAYAGAGRSDEALLAFRRAVELDCENAAALENLDAAERAAVHSADRGRP